MFSCVPLSALVLSVLVAVLDVPPAGINADGYLVHWAVLAPITFSDVEDGAGALRQSQIPDEAKLDPRIGDKVKVGDIELQWKELVSKEDIVDLNGMLGRLSEASVGYAVTIVEAPEDMQDVNLSVGSDDQCRVILNGKEVLYVSEPRALEKDQDLVRVNLKKGANVLLIKVVNQTVDWSFTIRFLGKSGQKLSSLSAKPRK